ncbi:hypothetical protein FA950_03075 [Bacillus thuringiensis]|uniref:hypothetical protein n=1 Tax=Bacillus thuringiensis TaxID=1428 RepID=UPI0010AC8346|nr:hypothetical protein [Bacillus thuringiensis]TKA07297.1 hypothetical protein FA950_03075 [Bacillus thuringiensis]
MGKVQRENKLKGYTGQISHPLKGFSLKRDFTCHKKGERQELKCVAIESNILKVDLIERRGHFWSK